MSDENGDGAHLKQVVETLLFITDTPLGVAKIAQALGEKDQEKVASLIAELQKDYDQRGAALQVMEIAEGFQLATRADFAPYIRNLYKDRMTMRLSKPALETISIIAYKQPLTRAEVEEIRGVEVIAALETLLEKGLIRVVGRRETVGRPLLYGTTSEFLRHFGLRSIKDLPPIDSFTPPPEVPENMELPLGESPVAVAASQSSEGPEPDAGETDEAKDPV